MPAQYIYQHAQGSNVDLSGQVRAYMQEVSMNAEEGSVAISSITVDDQAGGLDIIGHHKFLIRETSEASNSKTILYGLVADRDVKRGPFRQLNSREWTVNLADVNSLLGRPIMRGSDSNRPAETDVQRIQWLMTTGEMQLILDTTYISTTGGVAMDAVDYRDQTMLSVIDDCAQASGKNYWVIVMNEDQNPRLGLFYDFANSTAYSSSVRLTNVLADVDSSTTFAVFNDDLKLNRDPSRVYAEVLLPFDGGEVFVTDAATLAQYGRRDTTAPSVNVKSSAKATARALRYLSDISTEEDRLTMSYLVPLAKVNRLMHGHRFQVKFSHLPGYQDWTYVRAVKRTVKMESEEFYRVTIEATTGGGTVVTSPTCASVISTGTSYDSGAVLLGCHDWSAGPISSVLSLSPSSPSLIIGMIAGMQCSFTPGAFISVASPYTILTSGSNNMGTAAYRANATSGGTLSASFNGGDVSWQVAIAASIQTTATSPVQTAENNGGSSVTLANPPTPGNIIIQCALQERGSPSLMSGYTALVSDGSLVGIDSLHGSGLLISAYCVQAGDTAIVPVNNQAPTHWNWVSEWVIT